MDPKRDAIEGVGAGAPGDDVLVCLRRDAHLDADADLPGASWPGG
jgi:hypothetical protein